jgi:hypothetical protein
MAFTENASSPVDNTGNSSSPGTGTHGITISSGDLVVVFINSNSTNAISHGGGEGTAFNEVVDETPSPETARQALYWKIAGASEPSSYTFTAGSAQWRCSIKVFASATDAEVDAAANTHRQAGKTAYMDCGAYDGQVISDNAVAIICGGKDNRAATEVYTTADNSYGSVIGDIVNQASSMASRIYTTGETASGSVRVDTADSNDGLSDNVYSCHISFVEGGAASLSIPVAMNSYRQRHQLSIG